MGDEILTARHREALACAGQGPKDGHITIFRLGQELRTMLMIDRSPDVFAGWPCWVAMSTYVHYDHVEDSDNPKDWKKFKATNPKLYRLSSKTRKNLREAAVDAIGRAGMDAPAKFDGEVAVHVWRRVTPDELEVIPREWLEAPAYPANAVNEG